MDATFTTNSADQTSALAKQLAAHLSGTDVIELIGDLGAGKTQFVRGLAAGVASEDQVQSPSFMLQRMYNGTPYNIHHFDFYRLQEPGVIAMELVESLEDPQALVVIEWAESVADVLPAEKITIRIDTISDQQRQLTITGLPATAVKELHDFND